MPFLIDRRTYLVTYLPGPFCPDSGDDIRAQTPPRRATGGAVAIGRALLATAAQPGFHRISWQSPRIPLKGSFKVDVDIDMDKDIDMDIAIIMDMDMDIDIDVGMDVNIDMDTDIDVGMDINVDMDMDMACS